MEKACELEKTKKLYFFKVFYFEFNYDNIKSISYLKEKFMRFEDLKAKKFNVQLLDEYLKQKYNAVVFNSAKEYFLHHNAKEHTITDITDDYVTEEENYKIYQIKNHYSNLIKTSPNKVFITMVVLSYDEVKIIKLFASGEIINHIKNTKDLKFYDEIIKLKKHFEKNKKASLN